MSVRVIGADANNLKFVDLALPSPGVTLLIGASGSGKSSILAETIASEGGRRNAEFIDAGPIEKRPSGAWIGPMPPSLYVGQQAFRASSRTTVASATGILIRLRRLFLRYAEPFADSLGESVPDPSPGDWTAWLSHFWSGPLSVWAAPVRFEATDGQRAVARLRAAGVSEIIVRSETDTPARFEKGRTIPIAKFVPLDRAVRHIIEAKIGALRSSGPEQKAKLLALLKSAFEAADGKIIVELPGATNAALASDFGPRLDSEVHRLHPQSPAVFRSADRHLLSFNQPEHPASGACRECRGTGRAIGLDESALVTHPRRSMHEGAFSLWEAKAYKYVNIQHDTIEGLRGLEGFDPDKPWRSLPESARRLILDGAPEPIADVDRRTKKRYGSPRKFEGFRSAIARRVSTGAAATAARLSHLIREGPCPVCGGSRWSPEARALRVGQLGLVDILDTPLDELPSRLRALRPAISTEDFSLLDALESAASALSSVGLGHLTGARGMNAISGGESRRLRMAGVLNAPVDGLFVLLDEPARGLHEHDVGSLARAIRRLSTTHTVVVSDHRKGLLAAADHVVDMGTKAGPNGGAVERAGDVRDAAKALVEGVHADDKRRRERASSETLRVRGATIHNLVDVDVDLPLGGLTCITGVSGSGKSSFIRGALVPALLRELPADHVDTEDFDVVPGGICRLEKTSGVRRLIALDQKPAAPNKRSLVLTFLSMADEVRAAYAATPTAKHLGLRPADFGLNAGTGRCAACSGTGEVGEGPHAAPCPRCGGLRFGPLTLGVQVGDHDIAELLALPIEALLEDRVEAVSPHEELLQAVSALGLGYLALGRRLDTLSGGEVQRLRIARALIGRDRGGTLFVLDEPAAGLHPVDVGRLIGALDRMVEGGRNSAIVVEHNLDLIAHSDHVIDFGPGGGPHGGRVVADGTPERVARSKTATGEALRAKTGWPSPLPREMAARRSRAPSAESARRGRDWFRLLSGDDIEPPDRGEDTDTLAIVWQKKRAEERLIEIGGLDYELATFLVDRHSSATARARHDLLDRWEAESNAFLRIRPFVHDMQIWGRELPKSCATPVRDHVSMLGMTMSAATAPRGFDPLAAAQGGPLVPVSDRRGDRVHALDSALAIGAGYAELVVGEKRVAVVAARPLDLESGVVGPLTPKPEHLLRREAGACPVCNGAGRVHAFDEKLVIGNRNVAVTAEPWLRREALALLRSVRRTDLLPFLKRMTAEGLYDDAERYARIDAYARAWVLYGFWKRPGHGTFLKTGKDPSEVGSWLRWDGLFRCVDRELHRSTDRDWRAAVEASRESTECPECGGSGLGPAAELFAIGGRTLRRLLRDSSTAELVAALDAEKPFEGPAAKRHEARRKRLRECLANGGTRRAPLGALPEVERASSQLALTAAAFTTLPVVEDA